MQTLIQFLIICHGAVRVILNGRTLQFDVPPIMENDRTLVPLRVIFEALGAGVEWDGATQTVRRRGTEQ